MKRIAALAVFGALLASVSPAFAANPTGTVTIKWNTQQLATLTLVTNYSAAGAQGLTAPAIFQNQNTGAGTCTATGNGSELAQTANFGNVSADTVKYTDCLYDNGVLAQYATNDSLGYSLKVQETTAPANASSVMLCYLGNGAQNSASVVQSARTSNASVPSLTTVTSSAASCGGGSNTTLFGTQETIATSAGATAGTLNAGGDLELVLAPNAASGADQAVATWTLVLN
ncbi:MAG: hypothetical protein M3R51_01430 [Candidatus Eremiobacteraeota bacterium]|nr:hypothetical protein [Candidatus Eremiobacteraeota bacterium]